MCRNCPSDSMPILILELAGLRFQRPFAAPEGPGSLDVDVPQLAASLPEQLWQLQVKSNGDLCSRRSQLPLPQVLPRILHEGTDA